MIGTTLAHYRITAALGAGGMGEVWQATDTKLGREVALKVLPDDFADDPDRHARFEREAQVLASLNHPNIATLYGLEHAVPPDPPTDSDTSPQARKPSRPPLHFLVMELVEGEGLDSVIARGPVPVDETIPIALQIAEALEAAHEQGIVHRDLKPANIKLTDDGTVKVLDFGLAKASQPDMDGGSADESPTLTARATAAGVILGTAAYMSPEQARGKTVDRRADIWAFGVVLWEMLMGRRLFEGETVSDVLAAVLRAEPDLSALPTDAPEPLVGLVRRCLRKSPTQRLQAMGDARVELQDIREQPADAHLRTTSDEGVPPIRPHRLLAALPWAIAGVLALVAAAFALLPDRNSDPRIIEATVPPPLGGAFDVRSLSPGPPTLSPDGSMIVYSARGEDRATRLWVYDLTTGSAGMLRDTGSARYPFWSPDSQRIGFFTQSDGKLKIIDARGGAPRTVCDAINGKGGSWNEDGIIIFAPGHGSPIHAVMDAGGTSTAVTSLDSDRHNSHRHPRFLPDGRRFLFLARGARSDENVVMMGSLDGDEPREVMKSETQAELVSGHILSVREGTLMAQRIDPSTLSVGGVPIALAEDVMVLPGAAVSVFSASRNGLLTYQTGVPEAPMALEWRDQSGALLGTFGEPARFGLGAVSPNGDRLVVGRSESSEDSEDVWICDLERDLWTRFTMDPAEDIDAVWTSDEDYVIFASNRSGPHDLYRKSVAGSGGDELLFSSPESILPTSVSPDGRHIVFDQYTGGADLDIWVFDIDTSEASPFLQTPAQESRGIISPDGRWLAYHSDESGRQEVYVTPFPGPGRRWQVSESGGMYPYWRSDGAEIVFSDLDGMLIAIPASIEGDAFRAGRAQQLFRIDPPRPPNPGFAPSPGFDRFVVTPPGVATAANTLHLVVNWSVKLANDD
jgi:serine/threonine protein kinase